MIGSHVWGYQLRCLSYTLETIRTISESRKSRCRAKPNVSPPGYATSHWRDEKQFCAKTKKMVALRHQKLNSN